MPPPPTRAAPAARLPAARGGRAATTRSWGATATGTRVRREGAAGGWRPALAYGGAGTSGVRKARGRSGRVLRRMITLIATTTKAKS
ncbi:hypothetical protein, partial [Streptomyces sp. NPDC003730]